MGHGLDVKPRDCRGLAADLGHVRRLSAVAPGWPRTWWCGVVVDRLCGTPRRGRGAVKLAPLRRRTRGGDAGCHSAATRCNRVRDTVGQRLCVDLGDGSTTPGLVCTAYPGF